MNPREVLKKYFGYDSFREGQKLLIDSILSGRDVLGIMPTGAGKSICYQVPALLLSGITLVVSPLISLMKDQVYALNQVGIHAAYINSSLTENQIWKALKLARQGQYKIIYVAPERLETEGFLNFARQVKISMVTVDEAHCISQWGQDFRPSYLKIVQFIRKLPNRPIVSAFTATATTLVKEDILCVLGLLNPQVLVTGFDRKNLFFAVEKPKSKDRYLMDYVKKHSGESGIIYCATRKNVEKVYELLKRESVPAAKYHAGLSNEERKENQEDFIYDRTPVMVSTNAFGMGIDKSNVRYVIHYNMPQSMENYYQEAGRAGRDGEPSWCVLLYSPQDVVISRFLIENKEQNPEYGPGELEAIREQDERRLGTMHYYCLTAGCLREYILRYFGEGKTGACSHCSNCEKEFEELDVSREASCVVDCIRECRQRYGINVIAGILSGSNTAKLREYQVQRLVSYGVLKELTEARVKEIIQCMMMEEILTATRDKYALLHLTEKAQAVYKGELPVILRVPKVSQQDQKGTKQKSKNRRSDVLNSKGLDLFDELRKVRFALAKEEGVPPYIIFSDKALVDMCVKLPFSREEMLGVTGVGEHKYEKYGLRFQEAVRAYTGGRKEKYYFGDGESL